MAMLDARLNVPTLLFIIVVLKTLLNVQTSIRPTKCWGKCLIENKTLGAKLSKIVEPTNFVRRGLRQSSHVT